MSEIAEKPEAAPAPAPAPRKKEPQLMLKTEGRIVFVHIEADREGLTELAKKLWEHLRPYAEASLSYLSAVQIQYEAENKASAPAVKAPEVPGLSRPPKEAQPGARDL